MDDPCNHLEACGYCKKAETSKLTPLRMKIAALEQDCRDLRAACEQKQEIINANAGMAGELLKLRAAVKQYIDYWGRGGACQNLTRALGGEGDG